MNQINRYVKKNLESKRKHSSIVSSSGHNDRGSFDKPHRAFMTVISQVGTHLKNQTRERLNIFIGMHCGLFDHDIKAGLDCWIQSMMKSQGKVSRLDLDHMIIASCILSHSIRGEKCFVAKIKLRVQS